MKITYLELMTKDVRAQREYYANTLELPVDLSEDGLEIQSGDTRLVFKQAGSGFDGAYHFAFNIPENQFRTAKAWIATRVPLLRDERGHDEFSSSSWNATSLYFKDAAGNILEFIARHGLDNAVEGEFNSTHILNVSEIGLPSEEVIKFAEELCTRLNLSVFRQEPQENFTPVGDDNGLLILPAVDRIWYPNTGVPAKLLPVRVDVEANGTRWEVRGVPYRINTSL
jgi:catechol-2,3-dioxygenase